MKFIKVISNALSYVERSIVVLLLGVMIVLAFLQVILRNFFSMGFLWADPLLRHMVLWIGLVGASIATQQEKHINLDIITRIISSKYISYIRILTNLFAFIVTFYLAQAGLTFLQSEIESNEILFTIGEMSFQAWWFQLIIPAGFGLISFRFLIRIIERISEIFQPSKSQNNAVNT